MTATSRFSFTVRERAPGTAPVTSERLVPGTARTVEGLIMEARHVYAYELALSLARAEMNVLEIGHGEGYGAQMIGAAVASYDGVEVESTAVEHARSWYGRENVRFHLGDGATLPFAANSFDLVVSFQVIEHVRSPPLLLAETARVCRPGALVVMTTPNRHVRLAAGQRPWNRYHVEEYDPDTLRSLLAEHFRDVSVSGVVGNQAMEEVELRRIARMRRISKLDPLGLRYRLPEGAVARIGSMVRGGTSAQEPAAMPPLTGIHHDADRAWDACDLVVFARA